MVVNSNDRVGEGRVSPASASDSEPSTSILMKAAAPCRATSVSSVTTGTSMVLLHACPSQPGAPSAALRNASEAVETVGLSTLRLNSSIPALRPIATGTMATAKEFQRLDQRRLRLDRHHARAQVAQDGDAVAHMRANIEDKIARRHEPAVKTLHRRTARAVAVINPQRTRDAADGPPRVVPTVVPGLVPGRVHDRFMTPAATARSQAA